MNVVGKKLVRDCITRWNSSYFMLDRLVKLRWPVTAVLSDETEQWNISAELLKVLEPFDIATTFFSYEENPSLSCVLPVLHGLMEKLSSSSDDLTEVRQFKQNVKAEITRRWSFDSLDGDNILVLGCILDPRFKQVKFLSDDGKESVKQKIVKRMENIMMTEEPDDDDDAMDDSEPASKRQKTAALDKLLGPETKSNVLTNREELDAFMSEAPATRNSSPCNWWSTNVSRFPVLSKVAKTILNISSTSTPSERVFSVAGQTVTQRSSCLKPSNVDALIFLNKNYNNLK